MGAVGLKIIPSTIVSSGCGADRKRKSVNHRLDANAVEEMLQLRVKSKGPGSSAASAYDVGSSGILSTWMSQLLLDFEDEEAIGERPPAASLKELYDPTYGVMPNRKWGEQLLYRDAERRRSVCDVADIVMALEEGPLSEMLAYGDGAANTTRVYISREGSGIWERAAQTSNRAHELIRTVNDLAIRLHKLVINPVKSLARRLTRVAMEDANHQEEVKRHLTQVEDHLRYLMWLYEKALRNPTFRNQVLDSVVTSRVLSTSVREDELDAAQWCLPFEDGVYDIREGRLLRDSAARLKLQTKTVGYEYEKMMEASEGEAWEEYDAFMSRIFSSCPKIRRYLMEMFAGGAANENLQVILFHYNVQGSNGKSTLFSLVRKAFGELMMKCSSSLIVSPTHTSSGGPNEDLASIKGTRGVQITEPSNLQKLSVSAIKELTGGDEQVARRCHEHKTTFVYRGTIHVACNNVPKLDDMDGGIQRRVRIIPYGSRFVVKSSSTSSQELPAHTYYRLSGVEEKFETWKHCLMREILTVAREKAEKLKAEPDGDWHDEVPPEVVEATKDLIHRESLISAFVSRRLRYTGDRNEIVKLSELKQWVTTFCHRKRREVPKKMKDQLIVELGPMEITSNHGVRNYWRGWCLIEPPPRGEETDDEEDDTGGGAVPP
ncbi:hypothetical protein CEUSTIGMA_g13619.t1 [Chlamydomonas eustigma]|uniref:SF3 helicase domain-containing protein n=1 Tax=Chlamydomonas eustigma TaxID=1157962 RepID=A0A250XT17_9CHLO|nr:hypothetical protein CEUSTIGMA_g13619.t1 [Chlamydomonas eustigma]|eukprot:GAX86205.1 hypothetical protein CEUSTIGMA_g13619.t1 [Chlamydomonas eustigma]